MRYKIISLLLVFSVLILAGSGYSQTMKKTGSSGAAILKVGVGARAVAMGTAITTVEGDVSQIFWNPAGITMEQGKTQATFSYNDWIADLNHNAFAVSHSFGNLGTIALGGMIAGISGIDADRDTEPGLANVTYNTGSTFDYNSNYFALSYAKRFTDKLSLGATAKYYSETIDGDGVHAFAFDFGAIYHIGYRDLTIGARIQNLGGDLEYYYVPFSMPMIFSFGASMSLIDSDFFGFKGLVDATKLLDSDQMINTGVEARLYHNIFIRTGYKLNFQGVMDKFGPRSSYQISEKVVREHWYDQKQYKRTDEGMTVGAGVIIPYGDYELVIDYAWSSFELMNNVNRFSLTFKF